MTTSKEITLDHIDSYFSLDRKLVPLSLAPTATGGTGINNIHQYPEPQPYVQSWRSQGTDYVKKYLDKDKEEQAARRRVVELTEGSTFSINTIEDVDDGSTAIGDAAGVNDLDSEATQQIYTTYFNVPNRTYDSNLTISRYRDEILQQLNINPVVIIQGPTGCGKTTQVPQYILDYHQAKGTFCNIIVTQPRKIAAISIARRICQERKWQLGTIVGYQVAMDPKVSSDTRLSYVTTGVFLEKLVNAKRMDMYTHVIIDEVHERNQDIDFALLLVKKFLRTNSHRVKVILMSATIDSSSFASYFAISPRMHPAPIIDITGKTKEVTEHYIHELKTLLPRIPEFDMSNPTIDTCLYDAVLKLMCVFDRIEKAEQNVPVEKEYAPTRGAVLIFLPGYEEISRLTCTLQTASLSKNFWIIPLHSLITVDEQTKVFRDAPVDQRKVIISTNIAESSITVPDVKYVIDFCLTKSLVTDAYTNYSCLQLEWASKANCTQRKGRAGRVDIGKVYRMVPRQFYNELPEYGIPEIKRCPLTKTILHLKKLNLCEPQEMLAFALDPPHLSDIGSAVLQLKECLALTTGYNEFDGELTFIGRIMANLPLDIKLSKLIIFGYIFHSLEECIIIAASLSLQSFFVRPFLKGLDAYRSRLSWADYTFSDCLCYLNAYQAWKQQSVQGFFRRPGGLSEKAWAEKSFIQLRRIKEVDVLVKELKNRLEKFQISVDARQRFEDTENVLLLKMVIAGAFFPNYFLQERLNEQDINRQLNENDPHSTVIVSGLPPKHGILYASALKNMFASFSQNMMIEFEESKAYISFQRTRDTTTSTVLQAVYLALKMKKLRTPLEIAVFSPEEAERRCNQLLSSKSSRPDNQMISNRITVKYTGPSVLQKAKLYPPPHKKMVEVFISNVNNCGHFWARLVTENSNADFNFLENAINADQGRNLKPLTEPPEASTLYLAPYREGGPVLYYRAQIQEIQKGKAKVFFVDYGNVEIVDIKDLREVNESTPDVLNIPAMAFECYLSEVKPTSCNSLNGTWSKEADKWFKSTVNGLVLHAKVYSIVQDTLRVDLKYKDHMGIPKSVKDELIRLTLAEPAEESLISKQNHEQRMEMSRCQYDGVIHDSLSKDLEVSWKEAVEVDNIRKTGRMIRLRGPNNPLEVTYSGITSIDRCKCVKIERDSVNSVSINPDPQDPYVSMLVASSIGIGQNNQELIARNTTLMPKMRGLPALICLLFAPYAEIRTDKAKTSYTGALCGLGFDSNTGHSLYPDHDIEMQFDVALDIDDFSAINAIRMGFNLVLEGDSSSLQFESKSVGIIHEQIRKTILRLLKRLRKPKEPESYRKSHQWNQIPAGETFEADVDYNRDCPHILPLLKLPCIEDKIPCENKNKLRAHLKILHKMASNPNREVKVIDCHLCSIKLNSTRDLLVHLDSTEHVKREDLFI